MISNESFKPKRVTCPTTNNNEQQGTRGKPPGLVVNAEDSRSEPPWTWVRIPASPKKLDGYDGPLDGRKTNENNKDSQMGQVTTKKQN